MSLVSFPGPCYRLIMSLPKPTPASLFHRDRTPSAPVIRGVDKLLGPAPLALPIAGRIVALDFQSALSSMQGVATLHLELVPQGASQLRVHLQFTNVRELSLSSLPAEGLDCGGFGIEDGRGSYRPKVNWEVGDFQTGQIHFFAEEAEIVAVVMAG